MKWTEELHLSYRVYVRVHEDVSGRLESMRQLVSDQFPAGTVVFGDVEDIYWPIKPEVVRRYSEKGYLLTTKGDNPTKLAVIRVLPIAILIGELPTRYALQRIKHIGLDKFAIVKIVNSALTEIHAV